MSGYKKYETAWMCNNVAEEVEFELGSRLKCLSLKVIQKQIMAISIFSYFSIVFSFGGWVGFGLKLEW
jgi:hypothetical protein